MSHKYKQDHLGSWPGPNECKQYYFVRILLEYSLIIFCLGDSVRFRPSRIPGDGPLRLW